MNEWQNVMCPNGWLRLDCLSAKCLPMGCVTSKCQNVEAPYNIPYGECRCKLSPLSALLSQGPKSLEERSLSLVSVSVSLLPNFTIYFHFFLPVNSWKWFIVVLMDAPLKETPFSEGLNQTHTMRNSFKARWLRKHEPFSTLWSIFQVGRLYFWTRSNILIIE